MSVGACMSDETMSCVIKSSRVGNPACCLSCSLGTFGLVAMNLNSVVFCAAVGRADIHLSKELRSTVSDHWTSNDFQVT